MGFSPVLVAGRDESGPYPIKTRARLCVCGGEEVHTGWVQQKATPTRAPSVASFHQSRDPGIVVRERWRSSPQVMACASGSGTPAVSLSGTFYPGRLPMNRSVVSAPPRRNPHCAQ